MVKYVKLWGWGWGRVLLPGTSGRARATGWVLANTKKRRGGGSTPATQNTLPYFFNNVKTGYF